MTRQHYTARAQRDGHWWALTVDEEPGALTQVRRLAQAEAMVRDALALLLDVPEDSFDVTVVPDLGDEAEAILRDLAQARDEVARAERRSQSAARETAAALTGHYGLTLRDAGMVMGVSFQRIAQLTKT